MSGLSAPATGTSREPTDEELVAAYVSSHDRAALEMLIRRYSPRLRRLVISLVGSDRSLVLDAEQEIFATLVRRLDRFRGASSFSTFFHAVVRNRVRDMLRSRARYSRRVRLLEETEVTVSHHADPERTAVDGDRMRMVREAMTVLTPQDRMLLFLRDGEDESIESLCEMTGLAAGTIKSKLARGRKKVARALKERGYE